MAIAVRARMIVAEGKAQSPVETKTVLLTPALKVRNVTSTVLGLTAEGKADYLLAKGTIKFNLFYLGSDLIVHHQSLSVPFCTNIEMPGAGPGLEVTARATVANIVADLTDDCCALKLKAMLGLEAMATKEKEVLMGLGGGKECLFPVIRQSLSVKKEAELTSNLLRPASRARVTDAQVSITRSRVLSGKVALTGFLKEDVFIIDQAEGSEYRHQEQLELDLLIAVPGVTPAMKVEVGAEIESIKIDLVAGQRLRQKFIYILLLTIIEEQPLAPTGGASLVWARQIVEAGSNRELVQEQLLLPERARQVNQADCCSVSVEGQVIAERLAIHGSVLIVVGFTAEDGLTFEYRAQLPVFVCVAVPGAQKGMEAQIKVRLANMVTHFDQGNNLLDAKVLLQFEYEVLQWAKMKLAADCRDGL
jgi:hypothetical protein